eukprot:TRINITY_DN20300_c0_g1_i1.p1 TRINITY_DN20300_c0_g1~~TRINITY_DN20300_c0_g1_i1.p1  ORF type:complete len:194 (-),score=17.30 TRINITY_DN20300_c0_g1_i1:514-1035(-)
MGCRLCMAEEAAQGVGVAPVDSLKQLCMSEGVAQGVAPGDNFKHLAEQRGGLENPEIGEIEAEQIIHDFLKITCASKPTADCDSSTKPSTPVKAEPGARQQASPDDSRTKPSTPVTAEPDTRQQPSPSDSRTKPSTPVTAEPDARQRPSPTDSRTKPSTPVIAAPDARQVVAA